MDAAGLIAGLHGLLLLQLSCELNCHFEGLRSAAAQARRSGRLSNATCKKISRLDDTFAVTRHITKPYADAFAERVSTELHAAASRCSPEDSTVIGETSDSAGSCQQGNGGAKAAELVDLLDFRSDVRVKATDNEGHQCDMGGGFGAKLMNLQRLHDECALATMQLGSEETPTQHLEVARMELEDLRARAAGFEKPIRGMAHLVLKNHEELAKEFRDAKAMWASLEAGLQRENTELRDTIHKHESTASEKSRTDKNRKKTR
eukprot:TRINITY_DN26143_c0_g1_i1.p1 TRINITY_DN26143_c0_g1~~TRINITY_DN26143_c0_g1_i1.p1  ORF type:complete len:274 (-),score=60.91 TRINITY_DN26143_c0_g1_i1:175-957(-)